MNIYLVPNSDLLNKIKSYLSEKLNVEFNGYFSIYGNSITIIENSSGALVNLMEIKEFKAIYEIQINQQKAEIKRRIVEFKRLLERKEKVNEFDENIFKCLIDRVIVGEIDEDGNANPYVLILFLSLEKK